jgi:hypothetical protein
MAILVSGEQVLVTRLPNSHMLAMAEKYLKAYHTNKLVQHDNNHGPFVNQDTIRREFSKIVQGHVPLFHPELLHRFTTKPNKIFHGTKDINPFISKMSEGPSAIKGPPMYGLFQAGVPTSDGKK